MLEAKYSKKEERRNELRRRNRLEQGMQTAEWCGRSKDQDKPTDTNIRRDDSLQPHTHGRVLLPSDCELTPDS